MSAKHGKKLRRAAEDVTIGRPARRLVQGRISMVNAPKTTRGVYRDLKLIAKAQRRGLI